MAQHVPDVVRLRQMDFLNIPELLWEWTQPPAIRRPGALRAFQDIRVLKLLGICRILRKSHLPAQDNTRNMLCNLSLHNFYFLPP